MKGTSLFDGDVVWFDAGDRANGSLYIHVPNASDAAVDAVVDALRSAGLWSTSPPKAVADKDRDSYRRELEFCEAAGYLADSGYFVVSRFNHPAFPSEPTRYAAWLEVLDGDERFSRESG